MTDFDYTLVRRPRRKTATISVSSDNRITVTVPSCMKKDHIETFVAKHSNWVRQKIRFNTEIREPYRPKQFVNGEEFAYLGTPCRLQITPMGPQGVALEDRTLRVCIPPVPENGYGRKEELIASLVEQWYKAGAECELKARIASFSLLIGAGPKEVRIKSYRRRWGSCSSSGRISFDWKIMMAPPAIVDYIVVHELCHLIHHDHSPRFWKLVASILPDYKARKEWLKIKGNRLAF